VPAWAPHTTQHKKKQQQQQTQKFKNFVIFVFVCETQRKTPKTKHFSLIDNRQDEKVGKTTIFNMPRNFGGPDMLKALRVGVLVRTRVCINKKQNPDTRNFGGPDMQQALREAHRATCVGTLLLHPENKKKTNYGRFLLLLLAF
jgi:hypothetical protein